MGLTELKQSVAFPAGRSTDVDRHRFGCDAGDRSEARHRPNVLFMRLIQHFTVFRFFPMAPRFCTLRM